MEFTGILILLFLIAFLYATVGHGGASGYLGMMALVGISPVMIRPSALLLNILVSAITTVQFYRAGYFRQKLFFPFIILSVPFAFIGSQISLSGSVFKIILGICLLVSAARIINIFPTNQSGPKKNLPVLPAVCIGAGIGLISGMIGIGGGILLSPVLLLFRWADIKESAAVAAPFILINSLSGLTGLFSSGVTLPPQFLWWIVAAAIGGIIGSYWGSRKFNTVTLKYLLSVVLMIAAGKLFIS